MNNQRRLRQDRDYSYKIHVKKYGITWEDYKQMYVEQTGECLICDKKYDRLCIDHNHSSGYIRGLICRKCNSGLGQLNDDIRLLRKAVQYMEERDE